MHDNGNDRNLVCAILELYRFYSSGEKESYRRDIVPSVNEERHRTRKYLKETENRLYFTMVLHTMRYYIQYFTKATFVTGRNFVHVESNSFWNMIGILDAGLLDTTHLF